MSDLAVFLHGDRIGTVRVGSGYSFVYDREYLAQPDPTPLSLSLPLQANAHGNRSTMAWIQGLLPADMTVRARIAERWGVNANSPAALIGAIGLDLPGAAQVVPVGRSSEVTSRAGYLAPVDDDWIADRLRRLRGDEASWQIADERWSLGGGQSKFALRDGVRGAWFDPQGSEPSTHIVKPGVAPAKLQALNEHVSLSALRTLGISAATTSYQSFDDESCIVVERFDRYRSGSSVRRRHAEDMCQALANQAAYERRGGPTAQQILGLLGSYAPDGGRERFAEYLMATYLLGSPDGHARNYSVLLQGRYVALAPLYDVASSLPYDVDGDGIMNQRKVAISIAGERTFGMIGPPHWERFFRTNSIDSDWGLGRLQQIAEDLPNAVDGAFESVAYVSGSDELRDRFATGVEWSCRRALSQLRPSSDPAFVVVPTPQQQEQQNQRGKVWVPAHSRGGRPVRGHWRDLT